MVISFMALFLLLNMKFKTIMLLLLSFPIIIYSGLTFTGGRTVDLILNIIEISNWSDILFFVVNTSGHRLINNLLLLSLWNTSPVWRWIR